MITSAIVTFQHFAFISVFTSVNRALWHIYFHAHRRGSGLTTYRTYYAVAVSSVSYNHLYPISAPFPKSEKWNFPWIGCDSWRTQLRRNNNKANLPTTTHTVPPKVESETNHIISVQWYPQCWSKCATCESSSCRTRRRRRRLGSRGCSTPYTRSATRSSVREVSLLSTSVTESWLMSYGWWRWDRLGIINCIRERVFFSKWCNIKRGRSRNPIQLS